MLHSSYNHTCSQKKVSTFVLFVQTTKKCITNYSFVDQWFHSVVCFILIRCFSYSGHMNKDLATCKQFCRCLAFNLRSLFTSFRIACCALAVIFAGPLARAKKVLTFLHYLDNLSVCGLMTTQVFRIGFVTF